MPRNGGKSDELFFRRLEENKRESALYCESEGLDRNTMVGGIQREADIPRRPFATENKSNSNTLSG